MARPVKFEDGYERVSVGLSSGTKRRLEEAAALFGVKEGKRLSLGETIGLLLEESERLKAMDKLAAKARAEK
jgi:hypothetical protein